LIENTERFTRIELDLSDFEKERNQRYSASHGTAQAGYMLLLMMYL